MSDAMSRAREIAAKLRGGFSDTGPPPESGGGGFSDGPGRGQAPPRRHRRRRRRCGARTAERRATPQPRQQRKVVITTGRADLLTSRNPRVALPTAQKFLFTDEPGMEFELKELHVALACSRNPSLLRKSSRPRTA